MEASEVDIETLLPPDAESLLLLGHIEDDFEFAGHTFGLRTLKAGEEIAAAVVVKPFRETLKEPEAWAAAQVALALTHIDGDLEFCPQAGPDQTAYARARLNYLTGNYYWVVIDPLFRFYATLQDRQIEAIRAVQDLSQRGLPISLPSVDALNGLGTSTAATETETPS